MGKVTTPPPDATAEDAVVTGPPPPPTDARTIEEFDTTTAEDRAEAASGSTDGALLGTDVASLGDPVRPGFWIETPLVTAPGAGRVALPGTTRTVDVDLIPSTSGTRLSLAALRLLEVPLTGLPTVEVYAF